MGRPPAGPQQRRGDPSVRTFTSPGWRRIGGRRIGGDVGAGPRRAPWATAEPDGDGGSGQRQDGGHGQGRAEAPGHRRRAGQAARRREHRGDDRDPEHRPELLQRVDRARGLAEQTVRRRGQSGGGHARHRHRDPDAGDHERQDVARVGRVVAARRRSRRSLRPASAARVRPAGGHRSGRTARPPSARTPVAWPSTAGTEPRCQRRVAQAQAGRTRW